MKGKKLTAFIVSLSLLTMTVTFGTPSILPASYFVEAAAVKINKTKTTIEEGKTFQLKVSGISGKVKWKSNKPTIASVSSVGKITAKKKGITLIYSNCGEGCLSLK